MTTEAIHRRATAPELRHARDQLRDLAYRIDQTARAYRRSALRWEASDRTDALEVVEALGVVRDGLYKVAHSLDRKAAEVYR